MERLTEERGERTWRLFHFVWYVNLAAVAAALGGAIYMFKRVLETSASSPEADATLMMGFLVVASVLLMGAGISRYQARLEGQHLELKLAISKLTSTVEALRASQATEKS